VKEPLAQVKKLLCANIIDSVNDIWPSIHVIFEQNDLVKEASEAIQRVRAELGNMPEEPSRIIQFPNSKNKYELQELGIADITETILEVNKVITKRNQMIQIEDKCQEMELAIARLMLEVERST